MNTLRVIASTLTFAIVAACASRQTPAPESSTPVPSPRPLVGAIRWDAWHGQKGEPGRAMERSLGPKQWRWRAPWFAKPSSEDGVSIPGYTTEIVDREIELAREAHIDHFAFLLYPDDDSMSEAVHLYLASPRHAELPFCAMIEVGRFGTQIPISRIAGLMRDPAYQTVAGGRPLYYVFANGEAKLETAEGRAPFDELRAAVAQDGRPAPYAVILDFEAARGGRVVRAVGADALSAYAMPGEGRQAPYAELARHAEEFWTLAREAAPAVVPIVMTGWDRRPRIEHPVPWEPYQKPGVGMDLYYQQATPHELAEHLEHALRWVDANPAAAPAHTVLIYAWNEHDEGGWLAPTLGEGKVRLEAVGAMLGAYRPLPRSE